jgi:hypothetical protein
MRNNHHLDVRDEKVVSAFLSRLIWPKRAETEVCRQAPAAPSAGWKEEYTLCVAQLTVFDHDDAAYLSWLATNPKRVRRQLRPARARLLHSPPSSQLWHHQRHSRPRGNLDHRVSEGLCAKSDGTRAMGSPRGWRVPVPVRALQPLTG